MQPLSPEERDRLYTGVDISHQGYKLTEFIGQGQIGYVFKAESTHPRPPLACKIIPEKGLKLGWQRELEKVNLLRSHPSVVQYQGHGNALDNDFRSFTWALWTYIPGCNLNEMIKLHPGEIDIPFIQNLAKCLLEVLYACQAVGISHGDLHEGNILISNPDPIFVGSPRRVYVTDFGYGGSHNNKQPKDDFRQLCAIIKNLLSKSEISSQLPSAKVMLVKLNDFIKRDILEEDATQAVSKPNAGTLLEKLERMRLDADREAATGSADQIVRMPGDYLYAEAIGNSIVEWKHLFVPEFIGVKDLLSRNISILTGARGCGKTMAFRRLTAFMDHLIGEPSGVAGADQFVGFYLNCRDFVEAFPYVPKKLNQYSRSQLLHYFHLSWFIEVCKTLAIVDTQRLDNYQWLNSFVKSTFTDYVEPIVGVDILDHVRVFLDNAKEKCRIANLGKQAVWPLSRMDFLDILRETLEKNTIWIGDKPFYLFLDDYTIPIVPRNLQQLLNSVIFKRRSTIFFKISSEATNSFAREGLQGKPLELHQDFELIDLATESLHLEKGKERMLDRIFRPRIDRHTPYEGRDFGLREILGKATLSNNKLALQFRENARDKQKRQIAYHGVEAFVGMWTSDIRSLIKMFADMLRDSKAHVSMTSPLIPKDIQNKIYKAAGGEFLQFAESVSDPTIWDGEVQHPHPSEGYGKHLTDIAEAFISISRFELIHGDLVKNQGREHPKQAFRIEILDKFELPNNVRHYYEGLIRWHIFLEDSRGKSVRGMFTRRLYLNRILLPKANLTFSSHDNIHLNTEEFAKLLLEPTKFINYWQHKAANKSRRKEKKGNKKDSASRNLFENDTL